MKWKNPKKELPKKSGLVVIMMVDDGKCYSVQSVNYSSKHKAFNVHDWDKETKYKIEPDFWAKMPKVPKQS